MGVGDGDQGLWKRTKRIREVGSPTQPEQAFDQSQHDQELLSGEVLQHVHEMPMHLMDLGRPSGLVACLEQILVRHPERGCDLVPQGSCGQLNAARFNP